MNTRMLVAFSLVLVALEASVGIANAQAPSVFQKRVTGSCPVGSAIRTINVDGSVVCQAVGVAASARVLDANGNRVGDTLEAEFDFAHVVLTRSGHSFGIGVSRFDFFALLSGQLLFESNDCTGTPLLPADSGLVFPPGNAAIQGNTLYIAEPAAAPAPKTIQSTFSGTGLFSGLGTCFPSGGGGLNLQTLSTIAITGLTTDFTPPFQLSLTVQ